MAARRMIEEAALRRAGGPWARGPASASRARPVLGWKMRERLTPYAFLAPTFAALGLVFFYPMLQAAWLSLHRGGIGQGGGAFVGLAQYQAILSSPWFTEALRVSTIYTAGNVVFVWIVGLLLALMLDRRFVGRGFARAVVILPWATPFVAAGLIWGWMFDYEFGVLNYLAQAGHLTEGRIDFLTACPNALASVMGVSIWKGYPLATVMILAALQTIPGEYYEAAKVDGAGPFQSFWHVTLPGIRSVSVFLVLLLTIWSFGRSFTIIYMLTEGGPAGCSETLVIRTYLEAFKYFRAGSAAALGMIVLAISLAFAAVYLRLVYRKEARDA